LFRLHPRHHLALRLGNGFFVRQAGHVKHLLRFRALPFCFARLLIGGFAYQFLGYRADL
jgi:hypothetical protein